MNNVTLRNQMMKNDVLQPILDMTLRESRRDNLLSCSCQEFFDTIRRVGRYLPLLHSILTCFQDNIKELVAFCMTQHRSEIEKLAESPLGADRFKLFIQRYAINIEPPPPPTTDTTITEKYV